jgi:DNA-binding NarL/FixJ family response regulator
MNEPIANAAQVDLPESGLVCRMSREGIWLDCVPLGGYQPIYWSEPPIGESIWDVLPSEIAERQMKAIREALETGEVRADEFEIEVEGRFFVRGVRATRLSDSEAYILVRDFTPERLGSRQHARQAAEQPDGDFDADQLAPGDNPYGLSFREIQVLGLVGQGLGDKEIALRLGISIFTVNKHVGHVMEKMEASSRTEAAVRAAREGLIL